MTNGERPDVEQRILRGAVEAMDRFGVERVTVGDVAKFAGLSRATVYKHFKAKEDIFHAVFQDAGDDYFSRMREEVDRHTGALEKVLVSLVFACEQGYPLVAGYQGPMESTGGEANPLAATSHDRAVLLAEHAEEFLKQVRDFLSALLVEGQQSGDFRPELDHQRTAEWIARVHITSFTASDVVDFTDPRDVRDFYETHLRPVLIAP